MAYELYRDARVRMFHEHLDRMPADTGFDPVAGPSDALADWLDELDVATRRLGDVHTCDVWCTHPTKGETP